LYAFIYVFDEKAKKALMKQNYHLLREDEKSDIWIFENKDPENYDFSFEYPFVLSSTMSF